MVNLIHPPYTPEFYGSMGLVPSLKLTAKAVAPEIWWLEDDPFLLAWPIFRGHVSFRESIFTHMNGWFL